MVQGKGQSGARREPVFDSAPELRVGASDRAGNSGKPTRRKRTRQPRKIRRKRSLIGRAIYWSLVLGLWLAIGGAGVIAWTGAHMPPLQSLEIPKRPPSIQIVDVNDHPLATRGDSGGAVLPLKELPSYVPKAFIAIEDRRFYEHYGVDPWGIARAIVANILHRGVAQGASTITQQLAKNLFLTQERTVHRKLQEMLLALWLERKFSKTQILELYLNRVYFGSGAYGIEQAAQRYFGKPAREMSLPEAALLAGLVKSPSRLAPTRNFDGAERRAQTVLAAMADLGFITHASEKVALAHPPRVVAQGGGGAVNYVADWVLDAINDVLGHVDEDIVVRTTIDASLQAGAEKAITEEMAQKGDKNGVSQGALVAMTPDGAVRAMIGGRNYGESQFNRAVAAKRQPGSAFKPFVYLTALEHGLTPDTVRQDAPIRIKGWQPENYGHEYYGPVTLAKALALSLNTVSVRLTMEFSPAAVIRTAYRLGIASKLEPNASIALGTSEVSPLELVSAYAPFANGGLAVVPHVVERVAASNGKVLYNAQRAAARPHHRRALRRDDERDDGADIDDRYRPQGCAAGLARPPARPAPPRISATPGSSATPPISSPACGSAMTTARRPRRSPAAACRWKSGAASCAARITAFRSPPCPARRLAARCRACSAAIRRRRQLYGMAPVQAANNTPGAHDGASLDGWLLDNLFGHSRN